MIKKRVHIKFLIFIVILFFSFALQDKPLCLVIKSKLNYFATDNMGNVYTVKEEELVKYLSNGKLFARYSNLQFGNISAIDATNPLKLILYYRDFQQIVFLDNQLTSKSESISLEALGYEQADLVCASANNGFWLYNKQNNELVRFNENLKQITITGNLKQLLQTNIKPNFMREHNGYLYLNSPENGIFVFDIFGTFNRIISLKNLKQFDVYEDVIYFQKDSSLCSYNFKLFEEACKKLPKYTNAIEAKYYNNKVYVGYKDSLIIYY